MGVRLVTFDNMKVIKQDMKKGSASSLVGWYILFGALHELSHVLAASCLGACSFRESHSLVALNYEILLGRQVTFPELPAEAEYIIRHVGWIASLLLAFCALATCRGRPRMDSVLCVAACVTACEALWTDALQFPVLSLWNTAAERDPARVTTFFCGNFGIILLHSAWFSDQGKSALTILEKMVQVTMMRGAQQGGVVTFHPASGNQRRGVRSRVVNQKRTDLSRLVRQKVQQDNFGGLWGKGFASGQPGPTVFAGHTRFATSSKATMEGTHPHQWTPPSLRRVYNFSVPHNGTPATIPQLTRVENYITHNGDFDFYTVNGKTYEIETIQRWLEQTTGSPMPAVVDSCAIAGMVDLMRTQGCFDLSARYAVCIALSSAVVESRASGFPSYSIFEEIGKIFEDVLTEMLKANSLSSIDESNAVRESFATRVVSKLQQRRDTLLKPLCDYIHYNKESDEESDASIYAFSLATINAFFDNDLFMVTKTFLKNARGSFGLCVTSSLDAHRQICLAARGQTMSVAFYPRKGLITYGSEQAAVKAGMIVDFPGDEDALARSLGDVDNDVLRLDLDDLGGEVLLLDWGCALYQNLAVSVPNRSLVTHDLMNGQVAAILFQESKATTRDPQIYHRMTRLSRNRLIKPLREESSDLVLSDIRDIPTVCRAIQDDWDVKSACTSLNRLTAFNLSRCLRDRLDAHVAGTVSSRAVDILVTGCEVSLWLAEQFASDLRGSFPKLRTMAISSNKILGLYGQDIALPSFGFPFSPKTHYLHDTIVIIVSHSGGTFAPLSCSNLLTSTTKNIFVVTSEWDTQIGKQLRAMDALDNNGEEYLFNSRIFSTEVGMRPAEPCSVSVAATHQLLTNLFEYIGVLILSEKLYRSATAATISEHDLEVLEKCNRDNILALTEIVGANRLGCVLDSAKNIAEHELRRAGDIWAEHILEVTRAYIMTFAYIFTTVTTGYPLVYAIAYTAGLDSSSRWVYLVRSLDAAIYFWLPQINVIIIRLIQRRNLLHRMVGRSVVIGDIPWVAQAGEAFLSKIFACSYSIAGISVHSGNPSDHLVHRMTHRVVRGALLVCGRPDGRLSALASAESAVCLSVNQASSIQSLGGTCESITIGHNPFQLPLTSKGIFLKRKRPLFLCERMLVEADAKEETENSETTSHHKKRGFMKNLTNGSVWSKPTRAHGGRNPLDASLSIHRDSSVRPRLRKDRSAAALLGAYQNLEDSTAENEVEEELTVNGVVRSAIQERKWSDKAKKLFQMLDLDGDGFLREEEFVEGSFKLQATLTKEELKELFRLADGDSDAHLDYDDFLRLLHITDLESGLKIPSQHRDERGLIQLEPSKEKYFGETLRKYNTTKSRTDVDFNIAHSQENAMQLYETRIASMQRFVAMTVMFHQMGMRVESFFRKISFGWLGYRIDRTHSIMRIATTASPVSGAHVRQRMRQMQLLKKVHHSVHVISVAYLHYKSRKEARRILELEHQVSLSESSGGAQERERMLADDTPQ
jgi:hypothetical protein